MAESTPKNSAEESDLLGELVARSGPFIPIAVLLAAAVLGVLRGAGGAVLVLAAAALVIAIGMLWTSLRVLTGEAPLSIEEAINIGSPSALDEEKRAILRALKDLEFEYGLGKLTEDDYRELKAKYRAQAKAVLQKMDASMGPARQKAEAMLAARLAGEQDEALDEPSKPSKKAKRAKATRVEAERADDVEGAAVLCASCQASNDSDAAFCKKCGSKLTADAQR